MKLSESKNHIVTNIRIFIKLLITTLIVLSVLTLVTACQTPIIANDPHNECDHPSKPQSASDKDIALYITAQGEKIDICRALLGKKKSPLTLEELKGI